MNYVPSISGKRRGQLTAAPVGVLTKLRVFFLMVSALSAVLSVHAESYPTRPIELVVANPPGGGTDVAGRAIAEALQKQLGQPVVVMNKAGASTSIGLADVARAKPDGYKLVVMLAEASYISALGIGRVTNDDFTPIARFTEDPASVTVRMDAPWTTLEEFLAYSRANPEKVRVANAGPGGIWHLAAAALEEKTQTKFLHVPYQGSAPAFMALLAGQVDATTVSPGEMAQHIRAGKLKVLGVMSPERLEAFEGIPTLAERGIDLKVSVYRGLGAPRATPDDVVEALRKAAQHANEDPSLRSRIKAQSLNYSYADKTEFSAALARSSAVLRPLAERLKLSK